MPDQSLVDVKIPQPAYAVLERYATDEDRPAAEVLEDSVRLYAERAEAFRRMGEAMQRMQEQAVRNGTSTMSMEAIDAEIAAVRMERRNRSNPEECSS